MAGTIYGTHAHLEPAEVLTCAGYNLLVYAVLPLIYFRRRYSPWALSLRSSDRAASRGRRRDPVYGQRLGARLGLPRLCPAHTYRYPHIVDIFRIR
jgi:hypothetical protein